MKRFVGWWDWKAARKTVLSGLLFVLSFPRFEYDFLAWIAFIPLLFAIQNKASSRRFLWGWITGVVYFTGTLSWVTISMHHYGSLPWSVSYLLMLLLVAYLACYVGLFALGCGCYSGSALILWAPVLWTALEYARGHLLSGFPWVSLGYSQYRRLALIQIADFASVYGVGFMIVLVNVALFRLLRAWRSITAWKECAAVLLIVALAWAYGVGRLSQPAATPHTLSVAVVQGNIAQDQKWSQDFRNATIETYKRLSLHVVREARPDLIVWPESAIPFFFESDPQAQSDLLNLARAGASHLLFGSPAFERTIPDTAQGTTPSAGLPDSGEQVHLFNSAYLLSPRGHITRYDKIHLVPFGEYVPFASLLFFVDKMVEGIGDFRPGREAVVADVQGETVGTAICFEVIFPELVRRFVAGGATLMTTITNDAWFGDSAAPDQHFSMVIFRAIENRVPFARAANTGISGFIDAEGRILSRTALFTEATQVASLYPGRRKTFYTTYGDLFAIVCVTIAAAGAIYGRAQKMKGPLHVI